jgi:hypothetical protein
MIDGMSLTVNEWTNENIYLHSTIENSPLSIMCDTSNESTREEKNSTAEFYFKMMGINRYQSFFYDLNGVSVVQKGLDIGYIKPVSWIVKYL